MPGGQFLVNNLIGGVLWASALPVLGFYLGKRIPNIDKYLLPIIIGVVILSIIPALIHLFGQSRKDQAKTTKQD